jgi:hypothetical protein
MDITTAKKLILNSVNNLAGRRSTVLTVGDLQAEVINNGCRYLLDEHRLYIDQVHDVSQISSVLTGNFRYQQEAQLFTRASLELFPGQYTTQMAAAGEMSILSNISWSGMWDFLREYFHQNHGKQIDGERTLPVFFNSSVHSRYEYGNLITESSVNRVVSLTFKQERTEVLVSISPSLSPKNAYRVAEVDGQTTYRGYDPDYQFSVRLDLFDEVEQFILEMPNRGLKIVYA